MALDHTGKIVALYDDLQRGADVHPRADRSVAIGENYLRICDEESERLESARRAAGGLRLALGPERRPFQMIYTREVQGESRTFQLNVLPLAGEQGGAVAFHTELTEHLRCDRERREFEALHDLLMEFTAAGYLLVDEDARLLSANAQFLRMLGQASIDTVHHRVVTEWIAAGDRSAFTRALKAAWATDDRQRVELAWERADGGTTTVALTAKRLGSAGEGRIAIFCLDLGAPQAPQKPEIADDGAHIACRLSADTTITFANEMFCRFAGKRLEEILGQRLADVFSPPANHALTDSLARLRALDRATTCEHVAIDANGESRWLSWSHQPVRPWEGSRQIHSVARDITRYQRTEEALQENRRRVEDLTARLMHAHETVCSRIAREMHDGFSQMIAAHTINLSVLLRKFGDAAPELKESILKLEKDAQQIAEGVRDFSHQLHPAVVERLGLIGALRTMCHQQGNLHGLRVVTHIVEPLPRLSSQLKNTIYRIAQEIVANIAKHARARRFALHLTAADDRLRLEVEDDGVGFNPAVMSESMSFGLLSIEERVGFLNGEVTIESAPDSGTRVVIVLPVRCSVEEK